MQGVDYLLGVYLQLTSSNIDDQPEDKTISVHGPTLRTAFEEAIRQFRAEQQARAEAQGEVAELKSKLLILQSEFDSKFPQNATISLPIPGFLRVKDEDEISIKSFRPEDDDTDETVARKERERKCLKMEQIIAKVNQKPREEESKKQEEIKPDVDLSSSDEEQI